MFQGEKLQPDQQTKPIHITQLWDHDPKKIHLLPLHSNVHGTVPGFGSFQTLPFWGRLKWSQFQQRKSYDQKTPLHSVSSNTWWRGTYSPHQLMQWWYYPCSNLGKTFFKVAWLYNSMFAYIKFMFSKYSLNTFIPYLLKSCWKICRRNNQSPGVFPVFALIFVVLDK